ncbi:MAG: cache domain-containing protein, partial [Candidatus Fimadaptatus sp.]
MQANLRMTVSRNANYVEDAATQTARRIEDILIGAENSIKAIAHLCGQNLDAEQISIDMLQRIVDDTPFDYMGIVDADGVYTDNRGNQAQVSDRAYFKDGMAGNAGIDIIFNGRIARENLMIFYAPLWSEGEVVGVLTGRYGENQMREIIAATYFDEPAMTYLCLPDGTVFSSSNDSDQPQNIITALQSAEGTDKETIRTLEEALKSGNSQSLTYKSRQGTNAAFVTRLPGKDWMLLQVFPIKVTNAMLHESNALAMYLELWLVLLFVVYVVLLLTENRKQKARLVMEKQEMR